VGVSTAGNLFFPKTMVFFYKIAHLFFPNLSQIEWHIIYPPVVTIISFVFFFLFVKELLNYKTAFIATAFLAVIPAYLQRTGAGFADHEAVAMLWMFISLWLFVVAWKSENWKKFVPLSAISGLFAGLIAASWGGYALFTASIALFSFVFAILMKHQKVLPRLLLWTSFYILIGAALLERPLTSFAKVEINLILLFVTFFLLIHSGLQHVPQIKSIKIVPNSLVSLLLTAGLALLANFLIGIVDLKQIIGILTKETANRVFWTVSENAQPFFSDWWGAFGWIFLLAFAGSTLYFYKLFRVEKQRYASFAATVAYLIFFSAFIFARFSTTKFISLVEFFSKTYLWWLTVFVLFLFGIYLFIYYKQPTALQKLEQNWPWLLLAVWFIVTLLAARMQIRVVFATVPPIAIAASTFVSNAIDWANTKEKMLKLIIVISLILISVFAFASAAQQTALQNRYSGSMVPGQWGEAMVWIRENTPKDAVFAHWWDYGYLTIVVGERAAVTDGGHGLAWDHASGRYFLTGKEDNSTLTYLKTHNVTHILISSEEIPKYHAFSFIGSDENLDRKSTIGIFGLQQQKEVRDGILFLYVGGWPLDKDYTLGKIVLSEKNAGMGGFSFVMQNNTITEPKAYVISNGQQITVPISCVIAEGKKLNFETNESAFKGCLMLVPYFNQNGQGNPIGGAFWLSEKVYDTNFAKLYMYNETSPYFKLVYQDNTPLGIYNGRVIGPIKIWEVNYPNWVKPDPFYLKESPYG
jgi:asparagine N-glycosylation enzyme membrane subunit Stt3